MKRILAMAMAMMMLFSTTAFAKTIDGVDIGDKTIYKQDETDQKYDVTFTGAVNGKEYMLWVVKNIHATASRASFAKGDVLYINQATAANNQVTFNDFLPMNIENSTLLISGQGMAEPEVVGYILKQSAGYSITGNVLSWDNKNNLVVKLYDASIADTDIRADMASGTPAKALTYTVNAGNAASDGGTIYTAAVNVENIPAGSYKIAVYKPGKYVVKVVPVTVIEAAVAAGNMALWLYGDVNNNGTVDAKDATQILRYEAGASSVFASGEDAVKVERLVAGNVRRNNESPSSKDATQIFRYEAGASSVFNNMK